MDINKFTTLFFNTIHKEYRSRTLVFMFILTVIIIIILNAAVNLLTGMDASLFHLDKKKLKILYIIISIWN
ncbi:MAG: hypothetical protein JRJ02_15720 [Deltaproteobacteria bacterium]|nr:hypothetical protein [Deltaproteobacteria bacterium]